MVDSISLLSSLETTRNPFESGFEERTNYPGFSPSMFAEQNTPASQKKRRTFRWSIDQISRLNPAEIDEFPNQEYSSTFEREEDEIETQKAIDEYFSQNAIVPSPWTPNHSIKHVKFSPLPPTTAYIVTESSVESSPNSSTSKVKADAGSQTKLSLPPDFDLQIHLDPAYYNHKEQEGSRDVSISSLRRKLFSHEEKRTQTDKGLLGPPNNIKSILKSPRSPALVTSSPVSSKVTPGHNLHRHSSASTISSPNISPIKPLTTSDKLTPTGRPRLSRQTLSPMDFSVNVLESSGIVNGGAVFPDISPIKGDEENGSLSQKEQHIEEMDFDIGSGDSKENQNSSVDDGGPLDISALSVKDEVVIEKEDENDDADDKMPPKITVEDLADESVLTSESSGEQFSTNSKLIQQTSRDSQSADDCITETMDVDNKDGEAGVQEKDIPSKSLAKESSLEIEEIGPSLSHDLLTEGYKYGLSKLGEGNSGHYNGISDRGRNYRTQKSFPKLSHFTEIDEDIILMRAKAALRRANKYSPPIDSGISFGPYSLAELNLNSSSQHWEPVGMSTPLLPLSSASGRSFSPVGHSSRYGYKSGYRSKPWPGKSGGYDRAAWNFDEESGLGRSGGEPVSSYHNTSLVMEDLIKRRKHGSYEGYPPYSPLWKRPSSHLISSRHQTKRQLSRTYPMTHLEWKSLYWRPSQDPEPWNSRMSFVDVSPHQSDFKRSSWPPSRPFSSKLFYGSRPHSPPVSLPPSVIPRAVPGGSVSKIAFPSSYYSGSDSGYSDWRRSVSQWESAIRKQHSLIGNDGVLYHY